MFITSPAFAATYAPDDRRASKTANGATTYYLYDEDGGASPLLEETYSGSSASVSMGYGMAEDGLRARYAPASGGLYYLFQWDPQGSLVQRQTGGPGGNTSYYALDTALFDGYGVKLSDTDAFTGGAEPARDAMGFQGEWGAYTDNETGLVLMGHRYYDAGTGRFLTRDPMGYGGGINLYGFTGNNPVNEMDPLGLDALDDTSNFFAGWGDTLSFGATGRVRQWIGVDDMVNRSSGAYVGGVVVGTAQGFVEGGVGAVGAVRAVRAAGGIRRIIASGQAARALVIANGVGKDVRPLTVVRILSRGEKLNDVIDQAKYLTLHDDIEHAVISYKNGSRALISGGRDGIAFSAEQVGNIRRILGHTHPYSLPGTGRPSPEDVNALRILHQRSSYLLEQGVRTKFR